MSASLSVKLCKIVMVPSVASTMSNKAASLRTANPNLGFCSHGNFKGTPGNQVQDHENEPKQPKAPGLQNRPE